MSTSIDFAPLIPPPLFWSVVVLSALFAVYGFAVGARGAWARLLAFAAIVFVLANPLIVHELRTPLHDVVALVLDKSQSMGVDGRSALAQSALDKIRTNLAADKSLDVRTATVSTTTTGENNGTQLFAALNGALADVPPERVAGAIAITDGEVHDAPAPERLALHAPLHALIAGQRNERDRKLTIVSAARFAIVGQTASMVVRVDDFGADQSG